MTHDIVGTTTYKSKHTGQKEEKPAALGIVAAKGSDVWLADLVSEVFKQDGASGMELKSAEGLKLEF